jgi:acetyltransferase-like isoleucine patch superfamily enzyme
MALLKPLLLLRSVLTEGPSYVFYYLFSRLYSTRVLRFKAAYCPYARLQKLLLRRSGVVVGEEVGLGFGMIIVGIGRKPPALTLKNRCAIGPYVTFVTSSYPDNSKLCGHPEVNGMMKRFAPICVEEDAWIGAGAIIMPGIVVGREAIVGAGAVVTKDVASYTIVAGIPAKIVSTLDDSGRIGDRSNMAEADKYNTVLTRTPTV